ncbi:hypothetical protein C8A01DRAFT_38775 [Parachaetomium inaequale]|uniref:Uncharacterized protein n=1 Tax=Parachaetomium inaequale TaxID=2588326 RepID=A0AAN6PAH8_9PEZI|nr:hypothetical protein C8A01DRAFT_38775 [Parachaetomium inaequale]
MTWTLSGHARRRRCRPGPGSRCAVRDGEDPRESKPPNLGGYLIQPEFKIRGKSHTAPSMSGAPPKSEPPLKSEEQPKSEAGCDSDPQPTLLGRLDRAFSSAAQSIHAHVQNIEVDAAKSGLPPTHLVRRAAERIEAQVDRLFDVYIAIGREVDGMASELDRFAAREDGLRRDLDECKTANFKLNCAKKDLGDQVELRRLKREAEDREAEHARLEGSLCELQEERRKTAAEKLWLEQTARKNEADVEKATAETRRLQSLAHERDAEVEGLKSNNLGLQSLVQQRQAEVEVARADNVRLQSLIRDKEAQISSLSALPITPLSPMGPPGPFSLPAAPLIQASQQAQTLTSRPSSPLPYIKQEPSGITPPAAVLLQQPAPVGQPQDPAQQLYQLGAGAADVLGKLFNIDRRIPHYNVLASFLTNLGAAPEASSIAVTPATVTSF